MFSSSSSTTTPPSSSYTNSTSTLVFVSFSSSSSSSSLSLQQLSITQTSSLGELIDRDGNTTYSLGLLYVVSAIYALRRFYYLWSRDLISVSSSSSSSSSRNNNNNNTHSHNNNSVVLSSSSSSSSRNKYGSGAARSVSFAGADEFLLHHHEHEPQQHQQQLPPSSATKPTTSILKNKIDTTTTYTNNEQHQHRRSNSILHDDNEFFLTANNSSGSAPRPSVCSSVMKASQWNTGKLFVGSIFFACIVRSISFVTLAVLAYENVTVDDASSGNSNNNNNNNNNNSNSLTSEQQFYHRVLAILFNVGDWAAISTYLLLVVVWVELLQTTRTHFFSHNKIRRDWMIAYIVLNSILYCAQTGLYLAVFLSPVDPDEILRTIYVVIAFLNLAIPVMLMGTWSAYFCQYAGFPFRSKEAKESWKRISRLATGWTVGRILWAIAAIFSANNVLVDAVAVTGDWLFTVAVVTLFVIAELLPFLASLGTGVLDLFEKIDEAGSGEEEEEDQEEEEDGDEERGIGIDDDNVDNGSNVNGRIDTININTIATTNSIDNRQQTQVASASGMMMMISPITTISPPEGITTSASLESGLSSSNEKEKRRVGFLRCTASSDGNSRANSTSPTLNGVTLSPTTTTTTTTPTTITVSRQRSGTPSSGSGGGAGSPSSNNGGGNISPSAVNGV